MNDRCVVFFTEDKITIQSADYIEDGSYIEIVNDTITLYEIPNGGGEPIKIGDYTTLIAAFNASDLLT